MKKKEILSFNEMSTEKQVEYICHVSHANLTNISSSLSSSFRLITKKEKEKYPEIEIIISLFTELDGLIKENSNKEEKIFSSFLNGIADLKKNYGTKRTSSELLPINPCKEIKGDHQKIRKLLEKLRTLTDDYTCASESSSSLKLCYAFLFNLEQDIIKDIYLEEEILLPKLCALEKQFSMEK